MTLDKIIHRIDKRLAVIEALSKEHNRITDEKLDNLIKTVDSMKLKVAGIAAIISLILGAISVWLKS